MLPNRQGEPSQTRLGRRQKCHRLIMQSFKRARAFSQLPGKFQIALDAPARAVARERAQLLLAAHLHDARCRRDRNTEERACALEKLSLVSPRPATAPKRPQTPRRFRRVAKIAPPSRPALTEMRGHEYRTSHILLRATRGAPREMRAESGAAAFCSPVLPRRAAAPR